MGKDSDPAIVRGYHDQDRAHESDHRETLKHSKVLAVKFKGHVREQNGLASWNAQLGQVAIEYLSA